MSQVEEDGDEVFVPIADVLHCGESLRPDRGFWRCPKCHVSFGPVADQTSSVIGDARGRTDQLSKSRQPTGPS
jgi:hypothetical protein